MKKHPVNLRFEPLKLSNIKNRAEHNNRTEQPKYYADGKPHVDTSRTPQNRCLIGSGDGLSDVQKLLDKYPLASKRSSNVCAEAILSVNHEWFDKISPEWRKGVFTPAFEDWVKSSKKWLIKEFGEGVASLDLHLDEASPHIHALIVPIAEYDIKYRRGSKTVKKINYNRLIGDTAQQIGLARREENPELTKTGRLQTRYAEDLKHLGLKRGIMYSGATHERIDEYRTNINKNIDDKPKRPKREIVDESIFEKAVSMFGVKSKKELTDEQYNQVRKQFRKEERDYIKALEDKAIELDRVKIKYDKMQESLERKQEKLMQEKDKVTQLTEELSLAKSEIDSLRKAPLDEVAKALNYTGDITWKGAIDMVKDVAQLDYKQAVVFLYEAFGVDGVKTAIIHDQIIEAESITDDVLKNQTRGLTRQEYAIKAELSKQLESLDADAYRVTLFSSTGKPTFTLNKRKNGEQLYTKDIILKDETIKYLNYKNWAEKYNIFLTPISDKSDYILVDDVKAESYTKLLSRPYTVLQDIESSIGNHQIIYKVSKDVSESESDYSKESVNVLFKEINFAYGDKNINGAIHPFRAVGFRNMKDKHINPETGRNPIVKLVNYAKKSCNKLRSRLLSLTSLTADAFTYLDLKGKQKVSDKDYKKYIPSAPSGNVKKEDLQKIEGLAVSFYKAMDYKYGSEINLSVADFMLMERMKKMGFDEESRAYAVAKYSPDLAKRHPAVSKYLSTTLKNVDRLSTLER